MWAADLQELKEINTRLIKISFKTVLQVLIIVQRVLILNRVLKFIIP